MEIAERNDGPAGPLSPTDDPARAIDRRDVPEAGSLASPEIARIEAELGV